MVMRPSLGRRLFRSRRGHAVHVSQFAPHRHDPRKFTLFGTGPLGSLSLLPSAFPSPPKRTGPFPVTKSVLYWPDFRTSGGTVWSRQPNRLNRRNPVRKPPLPARPGRTRGPDRTSPRRDTLPADVPWGAFRTTGPAEQVIPPRETFRDVRPATAAARTRRAATASRCASPTP